jgi:uncharacterized protein DUF3187
MKIAGVLLSHSARRVLKQPFLLILWLLCLYPLRVHCASGDPLAIRSYSPFTSIFGLPASPTAATQASQRSLAALSVAIVNHADNASESDESILLDGETYIAEASFRYLINQNWVLGIDIPYHTYSSGFLDSSISDWHKLWGISNANRRGADNQLNISYREGQSLPVALSESESGFGDPRLSIARSLLSLPDSGLNVSTRISIKVPSGSARSFFRSGATDFSWDIAVQKAHLKRFPNAVVSAHLGILALGKGDVLPEQQERFLPYGGVCLAWVFNQRLELVAQLQGQGRYFESELDELGGTTLQFATGLRYRWWKSNIELEFGLIEDLVSDVTPDLAFHLRLSKAL